MTSIVFVFFILFGFSRAFLRLSVLPQTKNCGRGASRQFMFGRFVRVVTSNINSLIKSLEDPEKVIEQAVLDMQNDLVRIRQSYAEVSAAQKRMEKQLEQAQISANEWYRRAQLALQKGDEELAREALSRKQTQTELAESLAKQLATQTAAVDKLYTSMGALDSKIAEAKRQKDTFIARARTAKTSMEVNDMLSSITGTSSMEAFGRMKEKVESLEAQAEVAGELSASSGATNLEERFRNLEGSSKLDQELESMRLQLPGGAKVTKIPELPVASINPLLDEEYEKLKREIRGK